MLQNVLGFSDLEPMVCDGIGFSKMDQTEMSYTHAVMKEMIHHVPCASLAQLFQGCYQQLQPGGYICISTRPPSLEVPLFEKAKKVLFYFNALIFQYFDSDRLRWTQIRLPSEYLELLISRRTLIYDEGLCPRGTSSNGHSKSNGECRVCG